MDLAFIPFICKKNLYSIDAACGFVPSLTWFDLPNRNRKYALGKEIGIIFKRLYLSIRLTSISQ